MSSEYIFRHLLANSLPFGEYLRANALQDGDVGRNLKETCVLPYYFFVLIGSSELRRCFGAKKEAKKHPPPTKPPPIWGVLTEEWQRPLILRPFWYRGTRDEFYQPKMST